jgi:hypothetical protein
LSDQTAHKNVQASAFQLRLVRILAGNAKVHTIGSRPKVYVSVDGSGALGHAGPRLLADLADATGLTTAYSIGRRSPRRDGRPVPISFWFGLLSQCGLED